MPSPKSRECWNPAVPPPPVAGATVGTGLGVAEGLGAGLADVADRVAVGVIVGLADEVAVRLTLALGVGVAEPVAPGEIIGGVAEGEDPEQAETAAEANMAKAAQPTANLALRPACLVVVRILMLPPHASGRWRTFPVRVSEERSRAQPGRAWHTAAEGRPQECRRP
jgi:hypothetical protein